MDRISRFTPQLNASKQALSSSPPPRLPQSWSSCEASVATARARILLGCYRKGDAEDPDIYLTAVAAMLASYPQAVVNRVTDPRTGIAGRQNFLPTVADVRHACEVEMAPIYDKRRRDRVRDEMLAARDEWTKPERREIPPRVREFMRELRANAGNADRQSRPLDARAGAGVSFCQETSDRIMGQLAKTVERFNAAPPQVSPELRELLAAERAQARAVMGAE